MSENSSTARARHPLEPDEVTVRAWLDQAASLVLEHLRALPEQPAANAANALDEARALIEPLPEDGADAGELMRKVVREYAPRSFNTAGPGYLAYIPGGGIVPAAIADLIANITNRYTGMFAPAPLLARLEMNVLRWFLDMAGFGEEARGILTSGGSLANLVGLVCARHKLLGERFQDGVVYVSDQAHHSVAKAARVIGFPRDCVRTIETGEDLRFHAAALRDAVTRDRRAGLRPAIAVASAGTTNTGVVDDLPGIAEVCRDENLWLHVDAAYGGFFLLTERGKKRLDGIERADSITVDPHKGLFLPYGTGCLLVRHGADLRAPHQAETGYLPTLQDDAVAQDFCEYSPELSRDFRGLRVWLPLKIFGARAFRACLDEKLDLAERAAVRLAEIPRIRVLAPPDLSLVTFRYEARPGEDEDRANVALLERVLAHQRVWMSGAWVKGRFTQRICVLSFRTHQDRLDEAIDLIRLEAGRGA
ncbi:MAG: aminotransferase class I/II-fold pyridoxal phosphate-dependent enzyme [Planctomycetes bacterium]|nr:aminotransferase class I/II-fold pyridoxal phosphate-dependent enzyme [Planctomycetota bacterium]